MSAGEEGVEEGTNVGLPGTEASRRELARTSWRPTDELRAAIAHSRHAQLEKTVPPRKSPATTTSSLVNNGNESLGV